MAEFDLIARYFTRPAPPSVVLGVGDDAALLSVRPGYQLAVSADMSVCETHFFADAEPEGIGWKSMAVNISDMAAMGAEPRWATLSIALPDIDPPWLQGFSRGLFACADQYGVSLIGGDTTRGPLNVAITILGEVQTGNALRRDAAQAGDDVWVSGTLGQAALWLQSHLGTLQLSADDAARFAIAMHRPQPRVALGLALRDLAHSALDISDGLLADLGHILQASALGAQLDWQAIPKPVLTGSALSPAMIASAVLAGGDDYELCFTAPAHQRQRLNQLSHTLALPLTRIGVITSGRGLCVYDGDKQMTLAQKGYDHFG